MNESFNCTQLHRSSRQPHSGHFRLITLKRRPFYLCTGRKPLTSIFKKAEASYSMVRTQLNARVPGVPHTLSMRKWTKAVGEVVVCVHATHRNYYTVCCYSLYFTTQHKLLHSGLLHYLLHQTEINRGHCEKRMWNN